MIPIPLVEYPILEEAWGRPIDLSDEASTDPVLLNTYIARMIARYEYKKYTDYLL
jgi:hypothetical protein